MMINNEQPNILVIDDNATNVRVLMKSLKVHGYMVTTARNGTMGLRRAKFALPDLILLDVMMPDIDGFEVCRQLKHDDLLKEIPVIFLTAKTEKEDVIDGLKLGAVDYVTKPFQTEEVLARVEKHLTISNLRKQLEGKNYQLEEKNCQLETEIAERKRAEFELAEKRVYLDNILRSATEYSIITTDLDFRITYYNPMAEKLFGYTATEVIGKTIQEIHDKENVAPEQFEQGIENIRNLGEHRYMVVSDHEGKTRYVSSRVSGIYDAEGELVGFALFSRDITQREQAKQIIKQKNKFLNTILESLANPFYVINVKDYTIEIANSAAQKLGITRMNTCYALTHRRDTPCDSLEHPCPLAIVRQTKKPTIVEHIHYDEAGKPINVEVHGYPIFNDEGEIIQMIEYSIDITERKQAEEQLRKLSRAVEQSGSTIVITSLDGQIEFVNPAFSKITGYSYEEAMGQNPRVLKSGKMSPEIYQELWNTISRGEVWQGEMINRKKNGDLYWEYATISPIKDRAGKTTHYLAIKDDITERKQVEQALQESEEMFRSIGGSAQDAIVLMDAYGNISYWNEAAEKIFGYSYQEAMGQYLHRLIVPSKHIEAFEKGFSQFKKTGQGAAMGKVLELSAIRKGGSEFPVELSLSGVKLKDKWSAVGIIRDITARKQAEKALHEMYDELELRVDELGTLNLIMQMLTTVTELNSALQIVAQIMTKLFKAYQCGIALLNEARTALIVTAEYTENNPTANSIGSSIPILDNPAAIQTLEEGKSIVVPQPQTNPLTAPMHDLMRERGSECLLVVPLLTRGEVIGTIGIHTDKVGREFTVDEVKLTETIAGQIAGVIENARLFEAEITARKASEFANSSLLETNQHLQLLNDQMYDELSLAREIQYSLLPSPQPNWPELEVACFTISAREIGGDFYTHHKFEDRGLEDRGLRIEDRGKTLKPLSSKPLSSKPLSSKPLSSILKSSILNRYALAVGDVSGKGVSAALLMAASISQLEAMFVHDYPPAERLAYLDKAIMHYTKPRRQNCAMCYVELRIKNEELRIKNSSPATLRADELNMGNDEVENQFLIQNSKFLIDVVNAGCIPPYIKRVDGSVEFDEEMGGFALGQGLGAMMGYQAHTVELFSGDMVILTSDGVVEANNADNEMLGFDRLMEIVRGFDPSTGSGRDPSVEPVETASPPSAGDGAEAMLEHLKREVFAFTGEAEQHDDMTMVVVRV
ncbi:PAS domain S-box protein [Anaerolineales bacterium HSG25]|nr:PAS domain S-box protein [Anaerolineales bacterium HSG25]